MSAELRKSKFVRVAIRSVARISFKFWMLLPLSHTFGRFLILKKKARLQFFTIYLLFIFILVSMGPYRSKTMKRLLLQITLLLNFLPNGPHKQPVWNFCNFKNWNFNELFTFSFNMGRNGIENIKKPLLLQMEVKRFQTSEFSSQWSSQNLCWNFWNIEFIALTIFFETFKFSIVPSGETKHPNSLDSERS